MAEKITCIDCRQEFEHQGSRGKTPKRCPECTVVFIRKYKKAQRDAKRDAVYRERKAIYDKKYPGRSWDGSLPEPRHCDHCKELFQPASPRAYKASWCTKKECQKARGLKFGRTRKGGKRTPYKKNFKIPGVKAIPMKDRKPCQGIKILRGHSIWEKHRCKKKIDNGNRWFCSYCQEVAGTIANCL